MPLMNILAALPLKFAATWYHLFVEIVAIELKSMFPPVVDIKNLTAPPVPLIPRKYPLLPLHFPKMVSKSVIVVGRTHAMRVISLGGMMLALLFTVIWWVIPLKLNAFPSFPEVLKFGQAVPVQLPLCPSPE